MSKRSETCGAVAPGRAPARQLTDPVLARGPGPMVVPAAGAGSGAVTRRLIGRLPPGSCLDIAEVNPRFAARLRTLGVHDPRLRRTSIQAQVHQTRVEYLDASRQYDLIVSGLPLTNFIPDQVEKITNRYLDMLYPGGTLTGLAYLGTARARAPPRLACRGAPAAAVEQVTAVCQRDYAIGRWTVWLNLPSAHVWCLQRPVDR